MLTPQGPRQLGQKYTQLGGRHRKESLEAILSSVGDIDRPDLDGPLPVLTAALMKVVVSAPLVLHSMLPLRHLGDAK